jgi:catechol 2,3-dioxygenase
MVRSQGPSLNHVAYEVPNIDGLMLGSGRMRKHGFNIEWGVGRHGPGNNVFSYFIEPDGFVAEYTTEVDQIDEATHIAQGPSYWEVVRSGPDRWGVADPPSNRMRTAMSGEFYQAEWREGERCEDVIGRKFG